MQNNQRIFIIFIILVFLLFTAFIFADKVFFRQKSTKETVKENEKLVVPTASFLIPTKTEAEKQIIAKIKTYTVEVTLDGFVPQQISIKQFDQIRWTVTDEREHQIKGETWGGAKILPGKTIMRQFKDKGEFEYFDQLIPELKGKIIVE